MLRIPAIWGGEYAGFADVMVAQARRQRCQHQTSRLRTPPFPCRLVGRIVCVGGMMSIRINQSLSAVMARHHSPGSTANGRRSAPVAAGGASQPELPGCGCSNNHLGKLHRAVGLFLSSFGVRASNRFAHARRKHLTSRRVSRGQRTSATILCIVAIVIVA
jgi:hypothetical protein